MRAADSFVISPFIKWLTVMVWCYVLWIADRFSLRYILIGFLIFVPATVLIGLSIIEVIENIFLRRLRRVASELMGPFIFYLLFILVIDFKLDPDWVHFQFTKEYYMRLADSLPGKPPRYHRWERNWTGAFAAAANMSYSLVYDESDKPLSHPTDNQALGSLVSARPLGNHFFIVGYSFE
jgi:hypothetical protein